MWQVQKARQREVERETETELIPSCVFFSSGAQNPKIWNQRQCPILPVIYFYIRKVCHHPWLYHGWSPALNFWAASYITQITLRNFRLIKFELHCGNLYIEGSVYELESNNHSVSWEALSGCGGAERAANWPCPDTHKIGSPKDLWEHEQRVQFGHGLMWVCFRKFLQNVSPPHLKNGNLHNLPNILFVNFNVSYKLHFLQIACLLHFSLGSRDSNKPAFTAHTLNGMSR